MFQTMQFTKVSTDELAFHIQPSFLRISLFLAHVSKYCQLCAQGVDIMGPVLGCHLHEEMFHVCPPLPVCGLKSLNKK